jgi:transcription elongation GreA/GreB family factor
VSKAFTKEDDDEIPERAGRVRSGSGLPPGAVNYMSAEGARLLHAELARTKGPRAAEMRRMLESATVVPERDEPPDEVLFGTTATVRNSGGELAQYRIVGVDETRLAPGWVSWVSPLGRALIGVQVGQRVHLPDMPAGEEVEIVEIG